MVFILLIRRKNKDAVKYDTITFDEIYEKLKVMDMTAFTLCKENDLPIIVFDMDTKGNLSKLIAEEILVPLFKIKYR